VRCATAQYTIRVIFIQGIGEMLDYGEAPTL
jgi:hypothetical protein